MAPFQPRSPFGMPAQGLQAAGSKASGFQAPSSKFPGFNPQAGPASIAPTPTTRLPFYFASLLLFIHFGRLFDTVLVGYKIPAIVCTVGIVVMCFSGLGLLRSSVGIAFMLLISWMCISAPFSSWKMGTFMYVLWFAQFFLPLMLLVAVASRTPKDILKLCCVLAFSLWFHLITNGSEDAGRYSLNGTFGNPDDVALLAGFTIPFVVLICSRLRNPVVSYSLMIAGSAYLLLLIGRTATRAAIPALVAMLLVYFIRGRGVQRLAIVVFSLVGSMLIVLVLPASTVERLSTILDAINPQAATYDNSEAHESALERHEIMHDGLQATIDHPIFGVGAGMFMQYRFDHMLRPDGRRKPYMPSHNTYVEILSECGVPGLIFYLIFLGAIFNQNRVARKLTVGYTSPQADLLRSITLCIEAALVYFAVCAAFMTCDRHPHQFVLAGFAIALQKMTRSWLANETPLASPPREPLQMAPVPILGKRPFPVGVR